MSSPVISDWGEGAITSTSNDPAGPVQPKLLVSVTVMVPLPAAAAAFLAQQHQGDMILPLVRPFFIPSEAYRIRVLAPHDVRRSL